MRRMRRIERIGPRPVRTLAQGGGMGERRYGTQLSVDSCSPRPFAAGVRARPVRGAIRIIRPIRFIRINLSVVARLAGIGNREPSSDQ